jgi:2'-5' RNA ligase
MESYNEFLNRINSFQKTVCELGKDDFIVNISLQNKVDKNNCFKPFYGDTVVFDLDDATKMILSDYTSQLYKAVPDCFCEKLVKNTFHMTLHDLSNSVALEDTVMDCFNNEIALLQKLQDQPINSCTIKMESTCVFNMVNTSLVLGLKPINEDEYIKLMNLYNYVDGVRDLPYPFTPHITLAYYNGNGFTENEKSVLENVVNKLNGNRLEITLDTKELFYQKFISMNDYLSVFNFDSNS